VIALRKKNVSFKKGQEIFREGDKVNGIFFLYEGAVKIQKHWADQKELIIRFSKPGDILGHRGLNPGEHYPVTAIALAESKACFITNSFLETTLRADPGFTYQLLQFYSGELQKAELRMRNLAMAEVKGRISETLLELLGTFGRNRDHYISVPVTRQDIAAYSGTTYETVFKFLRKLVAARVISTSGKSIRINDENKLRKIVSNAK
jgi:CRP/FNR family transcriptional regulator